MASGASFGKTMRFCLQCVCAGFVLAGLPVAAAPPVSHSLQGVDEMSVEQRRVFLKGTLSDWRQDTSEKRGLAAPPIQKPYPVDAKRIDLIKPEKFTVGGMRVIDAIRDRRSRREYSGEAFSLEELSYLLWATQGISKLERNEAGIVSAHYRTVPSGGARHPFETYLIINRVVGVAPGLYRYLPLEHQLLVIREDSGLAKRVTESCYRQAFTGKSAVVFVWSAIPFRTEWHYGFIAQKLVAVDVGHVCQNLYLAAESIHGGVCAVLGYNQAGMDTLIGLDGKDEFVIYLAAAGKINEAPHP
jgi:SagB-type dehydrogenase family enzyme